MSLKSEITPIQVFQPVYVLLYGVSTCSVLLAFAYRYFLLRNHASVLKTRKGIVATALIYFIYTIPTSIMFLLVSNADGAKILKTKYPKIYAIYLRRVCFTGDIDDPLFVSALGLTLALIFLSFLIATIVALKTFNILRQQKQAMSEKTFEMHRKMLMSLIVQVSFTFFSGFGHAPHLHRTAPAPHRTCTAPAPHLHRTYTAPTPHLNRP